MATFLKRKRAGGYRWTARVRRAGKHSSSDVHAALFGSEKPTLAADVNAGIRKHMRKKQALR